MSFSAEDGVGSLCHKALQIISELCLGGQVEREKCAGIFPLETARQGIGGTGTAPVPPPLPSCRRRGRPESATFSFAFPACRGGGWGGGIRGAGSQPALKSSPSRSRRLRLMLGQRSRAFFSAAGALRPVVPFFSSPQLPFGALRYALAVPGLQAPSGDPRQRAAGQGCASPVLAGGELSACRQETAGAAQPSGSLWSRTRPGKKNFLGGGMREFV